MYVYFILMYLQLPQTPVFTTESVRRISIIYDIHIANTVTKEFFSQNNDNCNELIPRAFSLIFLPRFTSTTVDNECLELTYNVVQVAREQKQDVFGRRLTSARI